MLLKLLLQKLNFFPKCDLQRGYRADNPVSLAICPIWVPGEAWGESVKSHRCHVYSATDVTDPLRSPAFAGDKYSAQHAIRAHHPSSIRPQTFPEPSLCQAWGWGNTQNVTTSFPSGLVRHYWQKRQYRGLQPLLAACMYALHKALNQNQFPIYGVNTSPESLMWMHEEIKDVQTMKSIQSFEEQMLWLLPTLWPSCAKIL